MPVEKMAGGGFVVTGTAIDSFRLLALKGALHLETLGMKRSRGASAFAIVKKEFGFKGSKQSVYDQFVEALIRNGILKGAK
jgi:hypothetical protein